VTEQQQVSKNGAESKQQTQVNTNQPQSLSGFSLSGITPTTSQPPPIKPTHTQILQLQRTIGNNATRQYLSTLPTVSMSSPKKSIQRTRSEEADIEIPLPSVLISFEDLITLISENSAFQRRMIARRDEGTHIRDMLRDHSNLQPIYRQLEFLYTTAAVPSPFTLHIRFDYEFIEGSTSEERVDQVDFNIPGFSMETFDEEEAGSVETDTDDEEEEYGLETSENRLIFVEEALSSLIPNWEQMAVIDRAIAILGMVNRRLIASGIPMILPHRSTSLPAGTRAQFDPESWAVEFTDEYLRVSTAPEINRVISDFYHEARHAEQEFLALRYLYGFRSTLSDIPARILDRTSNRYPARIRRAAVEANERGTLSPAQRAEAQAHYERIYEHQEATQAVYDELDAAAQAYEDAQASGDPEAIRRTLDRYQRASRAYRMLGSESDAYDVGDQVRGQLDDANP